MSGGSYRSMLIPDRTTLIAPNRSEVNTMAAPVPAASTEMISEGIAACQTLRRTTERLQRAGLIVDPQGFSPAQRRAYFALQLHPVFKFANVTSIG